MTCFRRGQCVIDTRRIRRERKGILSYFAMIRPCASVIKKQTAPKLFRKTQKCNLILKHARVTASRFVFFLSRELKFLTNRKLRTVSCLEVEEGEEGRGRGKGGGGVKEK